MQEKQMSQINISLDTSTGKTECIIDGKSYDVSDISIYTYKDRDGKPHFEFHSSLETEKAQDVSIRTSLSTYASAKGGVVEKISEDLVITQAHDIDKFLKNKKHYLY